MFTEFGSDATQNSVKPGTVEEPLTEWAFFKERCSVGTRNEGQFFCLAVGWPAIDARRRSVVVQVETVPFHPTVRRDDNGRRWNRSRMQFKLTGNNISSCSPSAQMLTCLVRCGRLSPLKAPCRRRKWPRREKGRRRKTAQWRTNWPRSHSGWRVQSSQYCSPLIPLRKPNGSGPILQRNLKVKSVLVARNLIKPDKTLFNAAEPNKTG